MHFLSNLLLFWEGSDFKLHKAAILSIFLQIRSEQSLLGWMRFTLGGFRASCMSGTSEGGTSSSSRGFCCSNFFSMISSLLRTSLLIPFHHNLACQGRDELLIKQASDPTSSVRPLHSSLAITDASSSLSTSSRSPCQTTSGFCSYFSTMTITNTYVPLD